MEVCYELVVCWITLTDPKNPNILLFCLTRVIWQHWSSITHTSRSKALRGYKGDESERNYRKNFASKTPSGNSIPCCKSYGRSLGKTKMNRTSNSWYSTTVRCQGPSSSITQPDPDNEDRHCPLTTWQVSTRWCLHALILPSYSHFRRGCSGTK